MTTATGARWQPMIKAMIDGVRNLQRLADLADVRLKATPMQLYDALHGRLTDHHRFLLRLDLRQHDTLDAAVADRRHRLCRLRPDRRGGCR